MAEPPRPGTSDTSSYDALPYDGGVAPYSLPAQMAAATLLHGYQTVRPHDHPVRVLELGCGVGTNLLSIACIDPGCDCVGVDRSATQIRIAQQRSAQLGLTRLHWLAADLRELDAHTLGRFDFIVCHGVLSWVAPDIQQTLLRTIATHLAPQGTALISFNVHPGWGAELALREGLLRMVPREASPPVQLAAARQALQLMADCVDSTPMGKLVRQRAAAMASYNDDYLFHEYLEDHNTPFWFSDFARLTLANGLRWIGDATLSAALARLPPNARRHLEAIADPIEREQTRDIVSMNTFRYALCQRLDAASQCPEPPGAQRTPPGPEMTALWFAARLQVPTQATWALHEPMVFETPDGYSLRAIFPIAKAACMELAQRSPAHVSFAELLQASIARLKAVGLVTGDADAERLAGFLRAAVHNGCVQGFSWPCQHASAPREDRPRAWPLARLLASEGARTVPTALHENITLTDDQCALLLRCDGQTPLTELGADTAPPSGEPTTAQTLARWRHLGLIE